MRIGIFNDEDQIASLAADRILEVYRAKPNFVLGLATGSSPLKLYAELVRRYQAGQISFAQVRSYNLDEYVGLPRDHYEGYANFIHRNLVDLVDMPEGAAHGPDAGAMTSRQVPPPTTRPSRLMAALTSRSSASEATATSASTNPEALSPHAPTWAS